MAPDDKPLSTEENASPSTPDNQAATPAENQKSGLINFFALDDEEDATLDDNEDETPITLESNDNLIQGGPRKSLTSALINLFGGQEDENDDLFASFPPETASITSPESLTYLQFTNSPQITSASILEFINNRRAALSLRNPQGTALAEPKTRYASTGWIIIDYGNRLLTGPGDRAFDRDFLTAPARATTQELVHLAQERKWPEIAIDSLDNPETQPLAEKMRLFAWQESNHLGLYCTGFTPTQAETFHLEHIRKVLGNPTPSDPQIPT